MHLDYAVKQALETLIHHQGVICYVAFDRFSLRRITYTPQSALLDALHLPPCWCPGLSQNPLSLVQKRKFDGGFWGDEPRKVFHELSQNKFTDVVLPTRNGKEIKLRCVGTPTKHQQILLQHLKLNRNL